VSPLASPGVTSLDGFDYPLPAAAIAQVPAEPRDAARLLVDLDGVPAHHHVRDLPDLLEPGDLLVVNDTRVMPARLRLHKKTGGAAEVLLLEPAADNAADNTDTWEALVRPGRRLPAGTRLLGDDGSEVVEVGEPSGGTVGDVIGDDGRRRVRLLGDPDRHGTVPLPPYITTPLPDPERYQTVYAERPASVAAPTAGLHLSSDVLDRCRGRGIDIARVELVVGLDTFRPITAETLEGHVMHSERYAVPAETVEACRRARRVVAIGTTTVRALESAARGSLEGRTDLFIRGDFPFEVVDVLLTNFHMPRSSLLVLLDAFAGPRWRTLYEVALAEGYRFLSFGDAMLVGRGAR
jgi:S-adenosylmethionine:tRNA ribosyltransferase-isomerase